jgi:transglutaminase-like putative cysteine protease
MNDMPETMDLYLQPGHFVNSAEPAIVAYAQRHAGHLPSQKSQAIALFYAVRDGFKYNPYHINMRMRATDVLQRQEAHCVDKACLLTASCRALGIPARMGFGAVRNHLATSRLEQLLGTDVLAFHGYSEIFLEGRWVKATPAFNRELCERFNVEPLGFDGENDCLFQQEDRSQGKFMEYIDDYGPFHDIPIDVFIAKMMEHYGHLFTPEVLATGRMELGELQVAFDPSEVRALLRRAS